ncbi:lytic transglycosylase domain-containing protein [Candidimonas sp. SYP-B2681]|uniref:lytic transglycosylase domain-containing protein n=1 Tax=Candidimonas sp. SYP-B2681 TaxID=2497686 RepID=UPI000F877FB9|nr:transglycosylase SLT domain-containing protein [Candidimonas sp. SYP-B2681]RTZ45693.1 lytic transglycosylase domain-containing protein [Candidimonas sp. SYP-B2681]
MASNRQRYQKIRNFSAVATGRPSRCSLWVALSIGVAGCAGADQPVLSATPAVALNTPYVGALELSIEPAVAPVAPTVILYTPPMARQAVLDARDAMQKKQWTRLESLVPLAQTDTVLGSYANYWLLRQQLQDSTSPVPDAQLQQFMKVNQDAYLADKIKADWIVAAARSGNYALVNKLGPVVNSNANVDCSRVMSQHMTGQRVKSADAMAVFKPNRACWGMLDELENSKIIGWKELEPLLRATLETNKAGDAQRLAAVMFDAADMVHYAAIMKDPRKWLTNRAAPKNRVDTELVTIALSRLAYGKSRSENAAYVDSNWAKAMPKSHIEWVWSQFGLVAALNVEQDAAVWYRRSGNARLTDYNHAWQVRAELRQAVIDWELVAKSIRRMSASQAAEPVWVYWYARALEAQGNKKAATQHYESIANELSFYGQLASEELGKTPTLPPAPAPVTAAELQQAKSNAGLQRAIQLFDLGWRPEAVPEWNFALQGMSDRQLLAAAELARQERIYDRVVNTSLRTEKEIDFTQRFIAPFEGRVTAKARLINLDPAWVYGLIRQESRFITDARSRVGASGLMQLMPATARWVAKKIGMKDFTPSSVNDFDTNTVLGTNYLNMVLSDLNGSQMLATAGYNAGPGRPVQWRSKLGAPVEGAIFAETIPFTETRLYVKNVMSNATYYAMMFTGRPHSLKERLGTVSPEPVKRITLP